MTKVFPASSRKGGGRLPDDLTTRQTQACWPPTGRHEMRKGRRGGGILHPFDFQVFSILDRCSIIPRHMLPMNVKGNSHMISPDRTRLISILLSNSRLPGHLSPDLWHSMLIILILLIHATTRQQWNASWQSKRRRSTQILSTAIVTVALATRTGMKRVGTRPDGCRCHVPVWKRWNTASYIFGSRMLI